MRVPIFWGDSAWEGGGYAAGGMAPGFLIWDVMDRRGSEQVDKVTSW
jgi:hypothetical protein